MPKTRENVVKFYTTKEERSKQTKNVEISEDSSLSMEDEDKPKKMIENTVGNDTQVITNDGLVSKMFTYEECDIIVIRDKEGDYWYKGKDLAKILLYADPNGALSRHVSDEYKKSFADIYGENHYTLKLDLKTIFIDDSGFMQMISRSKRPSAVALWRQITKEILPTLFRTGRYEMPTTESDIEKLNKSFYDDNMLSDFIGNPCVYFSYIGEHKVIIDGITQIRHVIKFGETIFVEKRDLEQHRKFYKKFNMLGIWKTLAPKQVEKQIEANFKSLNMLVDLKIKGMNKSKEENKKEHIVLTQNHNLQYCLDMIENVVKTTSLPQEDKYKKSIRYLRNKNKLLVERHNSDAELIQQLKDNLNDLRKKRIINKNN